MAGITVKVDDKQLQTRIARIQAGLADATPLMRLWGEIAKESIDFNFEQGGRPKWKPLAPATIRKKGHSRPLIGRTGNLRNITVAAGPKQVTIGTHPSARAYAAIHQFGGKAGRGHKVTIPARPYIMLQEADKMEMRETAREYLRRLAV